MPDDLLFQLRQSTKCDVLLNPRALQHDSWEILSAGNKLKIVTELTTNYKVISSFLRASTESTVAIHYRWANGTKLLLAFPTHFYDTN
jgi:hypothetical protein